MGATAAAKSKVQGLIDDNAVVVFSKSYCPYCTATKKTLAGLGVQAVVVELDQVDDGSEIQNALAELTGQRTVPNVFIGKQHVGGNSDLQDKKASGELVKLLENAGALKGKL